MTDKRPPSILLLASLIAALCGPVWAKGPPNSGPVPVVVTLSVLKDFAEQIGRDRVRVTSLLSGLENQHTYTPSPSDILSVRKAALLVKIGLGLDSWTDGLIENAENPRLIVIVTSDGIPLIQGGHTHAHGPGEASGDPPSGNPHIWLDPENAKRMSGQIADALMELDPPNRDFYRSNQRAFSDKMDDLMDRMKRTVSLLRNRKIITHHDAWPYFARRFGFEIRGTIVTQPGTEPSARHLRDLIRTIRDEGIRAIVSEPQLSPRFPRILADETGSGIAVLSPIPGVIEGANDYSSMIEYDVEALVDALEE